MIKNLDKKNISDNIKIVTNIANKYKKIFQYLDLDDLISEGLYGLYEAQKNYKKRKNVKFSTYARFWIQKYIQKYITETFTILKVPVNVLKNLKTIMNYINKSEKRVSLEDISKKLNFDLDKIKELLVEHLKAKRSLSLDKHIDEEKGEDFYNIISDGKEQSTEHILQLQENKDYFYKLLSVLSPQESEVIKMRYGLDGYKPHTLNAIAKIFNTSPQNIREIEIRSLRKLRNMNVGKDFF